ncbi:MAG: hypothetical protein ACI8W7_005035 [Gammaproteobacteria bacterium]|jgi:hypothetical protein
MMKNLDSELSGTGWVPTILWDIDDATGAMTTPKDQQASLKPDR